MVFLEVKPSLVEASCSSVLVVKGNLLFLAFSFLSILSILKAFDSLLSISLASDSFLISIFL